MSDSNNIPLNPVSYFFPLRDSVPLCLFFYNAHRTIGDEENESKFRFNGFVFCYFQFDDG
jgi:hypothetical protein